jgi:hypothetical protein
MRSEGGDCVGAARDELRADRAVVRDHQQEGEQDRPGGGDQAGQAHGSRISPFASLVRTRERRRAARILRFDVAHHRPGFGHRAALGRPGFPSLTEAD